MWVSDRALDRLDPPLIDQHAAVFTSHSTYELLPDAKRFENWERYFAGQVGLGAAVDYLLELGVGPTTDRVQALGVELRSRLSAIAGVTVHDKGSVQGGIVTFTIEGKTSTEVKTSLRSAQIHTSISSGETSRFDLLDRGLVEVTRASVHYYNTIEEIDRFAAAVEELASA